jgi:hypothetical protein
MKDFQSFFYEKLVLGLIEDIQIDGIGTISSKLDTGNGAHNVLHGEDIEIDKNNKVVRFNTVHSISLEKDLLDLIVINVGANKKEHRPVVNFDLKMGDKVYKNIPFSIGNRSSNTHKVLIGKPFIENDLNALIDVSINNLVDKNLEVDI